MESCGLFIIEQLFLGGLLSGAAIVQVDRLWERYRKGADQAARAALIGKYSELVRTVAATLYSRRPDDEVEFDDYYQFGTVGLIESIDRYEPDKGASFETYASYRIRGAILNGIDKVTEKRSQAAYRTKARKERLNSLAEESSKVSLFDEMVEITLGLAIGFMLEDTALIREQNAVSEDQAYKNNEVAQVSRQLIQAVEKLPDRERLIIQYHYFHHTSFEHIAEILTLTKGRVSQIHKRALHKIMADLKGVGNLDSYY